MDMEDMNMIMNMNTNRDDYNIESEDKESKSSEIVELGADEITHDFLPFFRVHKDNHIERYILNSRVSPGIDSMTGVECKDVVISKDPEISGRMFLPILNNNNNTEEEDGEEEEEDEEEEKRRTKRLPLLIHFHGGGFCTGSAFGPITKQSLSKLVSMAQVVALSVDYRLAPEHLLPAAYEDSWAAFKWVASHRDGDGPEALLNEYVDFDKVYLGGESSGASIAHDVALRASSSSSSSLYEENNNNNLINVVGLLAIHPYFCSKQPEKILEYLYDPCSAISGLYHEPRLYPGIDPRLSKLACEKVLVCVAQNDRYKDRGLTYYNTLQTSMWEGKLELVETLGEGHCFHLLDAASPNVDPFMAKLASFIK